jgi:hypothetical protein
MINSPKVALASVRLFARRLRVTIGPHHAVVEQTAVVGGVVDGEQPAAADA